MLVECKYGGRVNFLDIWRGCRGILGCTGSCVFGCIKFSDIWGIFLFLVC